MHWACSAVFRAGSGSEDVDGGIGGECRRHVGVVGDEHEDRLDFRDLRPRPLRHRPEACISRVEVDSEESVR